jgi:N-carbamoyl-L-amino-acid hydrolase
MNIRVDTARILSELETLAGFSDAEPPAVTRVVFTSADHKARAWLKHRFEEAGLLVRQDAIGNTFARWNGTNADLPAVATGSHIDAIPNAGKYDGTVGVLGALEAVRALEAAGFRPRRSIEIVVFTSEEPTRFGLGCVGSRLLSGTLTPDEARDLEDDGESLDEVRKKAGFSGNLEDLRLAANYYSGFIELHIEQGPLLEEQNISLGIVTSIAAPASLRVEIHGEGGHAGAVLMPKRRDALTGAAELILAVESAARSSAAIDTVATTGVCDVFPGAVNSIPSQVTLEIDVRDIDGARRDHVLRSITDAAQDIAQRRDLAIDTELVNADAPAQCDPALVNTLVEACQAQHLSFVKMVSRAYHDSLFMSRIAPTAMLFIPCAGGVSHRPDEYASPEAIENGIRVLATALAQLAN